MTTGDHLMCHCWLVIIEYSYHLMIARPAVFLAALNSERLSRQCLCYCCCCCCCCWSPESFPLSGQRQPAETAAVAGSVPNLSTVCLEPPSPPLYFLRYCWDDDENDCQQHWKKCDDANRHLHIALSGEILPIVQ